VAFVGPSGAGKTTIVDVLLGVLTPDSGNVKISGVTPLEAIAKWPGAISYVPQDVVIAAGTIRENISFGNPDASEDQIIEAARQANALEFINSFPEGLETQVGDRGIQLSGGQKQRIAIARAIIKNPTILILDEATSALDSESERLVQDALDKLMVGRTSFVIAHRLSTIKNASNILVIQNGNIVESGTHDELIKSNGIYNNLVELQGVELS
jgi:ABC-type multidrug transport system fused ATPase/permease subunit